MPTHNPATPDLLTLQEAATAARVSTRTIRRLIDSGQLPTVRIGRRVLIAQDSFATWVRASSTTATSGPLAGRYLQAARVGIQLALDMEQWAPFLHDRAARVLSYLANHTLDDPKGDQPAATWYGGHPPLTRALGRIDPRSIDIPSRTDLNAVGAVMSELIAAGAVTRLATARNGRAAVYRLNRRPVDRYPPQPLPAHG